MVRVIVHLVDGTYELFRQFYGRPGHVNVNGTDVGATRAVLRNLVTMLENGATHLGVATDRIIESFRNELFDGYKTGEGTDPEILAQFPLLDDGVRALGISLFSMVEFEADDAMASAAAVASADSRVERVLLCTPDKDLAQCVERGRVVQWDRRKDVIYDVDEVIEKYGVEPASIPDWLGLVGDTADGIPGLAGWGAKSAAAVLRRYGNIEAIPLAAGQWDITVRGGAKLADTLAANLENARLYRDLAVLRTDAPTVDTVDDLQWRGAQPELAALAATMDAPDLVIRTTELAATRGVGL